jgi:hypothetical protein
MSIIFDLLQHHKYCLLSTLASAAHVCYMLPPYLTAAFAKANVPQAGRKFLASDQRGQKAFNRLTHTGGYYTCDYKEFSKHTQGHLFFDMLMLMRSSLFIGEPAAPQFPVPRELDLLLFLLQAPGSLHLPLLLPEQKLDPVGLACPAELVSLGAVRDAVALEAELG